MKEETNKFLLFTKLFGIFFLSFLICKTDIIEKEYILTKNNNIAKFMDEENIDAKQVELFQEEYNKASLYLPNYTFIGELTGYVANCPLCSGYLACPPRTNALESGIYFEDKDYGTVRIVASSSTYSCGTILRFQTDRIQEDPVIAIVLDRGVYGNNIDLLTDSEDYAIKNIGRIRNLNFEVLRNGWQNE